MAKKKSKSTKTTAKKQSIQPVRQDYVLVMAAIFSFLAVMLLMILALSFNN